jgi:hypothetical protein
MSKTQRTKGAAGERELCAAIRDELGVRLLRNLEQSRRGGFDLVPADDQTGPVAVALARLAIEVKRHAAASPGTIGTWWRQAETQAETAGLVPCLAYRADRAPWRFVLPLAAVHPDLPRAGGLPFTADLSLVGFAAIVREVLS